MLILRARPQKVFIASSSKSLGRFLTLFLYDRDYQSGDALLGHAGSLTCCMLRAITSLLLVVRPLDKELIPHLLVVANT